MGVHDIFAGFVGVENDVADAEVVGVEGGKADFGDAFVGAGTAGGVGLHAATEAQFCWIKHEGDGGTAIFGDEFGFDWVLGHGGCWRGEVLWLGTITEVTRGGDRDRSCRDVLARGLVAF